MYKIKRDIFPIHFQILSELSAWNDYVCSKETRHDWLRQSGGELTPAERQALRVFSREMRRGPDEAWGLLLTASRTERETLRKLPQWKSLFSAIDAACGSLSPRFQKLQKKFQARLKQIEILLKQEQIVFINAAKKFHQFLNIARNPFRLNLTVLLSKPKGYEARAYGKNSIVLISSRVGSWDFMRRTIMHEYGHILFRNNPRLFKKIFLCSKQISQKILRQYSQKTGLSPEGIIEELFLSSLLPEGRLGALLFPKSRPWRLSRRATAFERLRTAIATFMRPAVERRWKKQCSINDYWEEFCIQLQFLLKKKNSRL